MLVEDVDYGSSFCYPPNEAFEHYKSLHTSEPLSQLACLRVPCLTCRRAAVSTQLKGHPHIGPELFAMFQSAGFTDVRVRVVQPVFTAAEEGHAVAQTSLQDIRQQVVANGLATEAELNEVHRGLVVLGKEPGSIVSLPRIFQVTGKRKD